MLFRSASVASAFEPADLGDLQASVIHLGPLTSADMDFEFLTAVAGRATLSLDVQGFTRRVIGGEIRPSTWPDMASCLALVRPVKADAAEAERIAAMAPDKVKLKDFAERIEAIVLPTMSTKEGEYIMIKAGISLQKAVSDIQFAIGE